MLSKVYSYDECTDEKLLFKRLNKLKKEGKIEYSKDAWTFKIKDIDLLEEDEESLLELFDKIEVYPDEDNSDDDFTDDMGFYDDWDEN